MRIAVFQPRIFIRGGADRNMFEVFSRVKQRHEVRIFCGYYSPIGYKAEEGLDIDGVITRRNLNGRNIPGFGSLFLASVNESIRRISKWRPDAIVLNNGYEYASLFNRRCESAIVPYVGGTDWYKALSFFDNPTIWKIPGISHLVSFASCSTQAVKTYHQFENMKRLRTLLALRRCAINICVSAYVSRFLKRIDPKIETKVVNPGVDHKFFKPTFEDEDYVLNVTRIHPNKNPMLSVKSVEGTEHQLRICANMERGFLPYERYYQNLLSMKRDNVRIILDPPEDSLIHELQRCSLFLSPARNEGVPLVILEAMACGKFVIGHNTGAQGEFLNGCGITCGDDPKEWREQINRTMSNRSERIALGRRAHSASMKYTWERTAKEIQETIEEFA